MDQDIHNPMGGGIDATTLQALRTELFDKGFVRIPKSIFSLDTSTILDLQTCFHRLFEDGFYETGIYPDEIHWRKGISREDATREICNAWKADSTIAQVLGVVLPHFTTTTKASSSSTMNPPTQGLGLGTLACQLMEWSSCRLGQDDVLHKPPGSGPVGFHQDGAYISTNFRPLENNSLTMWIALDDADEHNGALQYAVGSHQWKPEKNSSHDNDTSALSFHVGKDDDPWNSLRQAARQSGVDPDMAVASRETVPVRKGEMVVHHQDVWHGSGPNYTTDRHRRALVAHVLDGTVQWRPDHIPQYIYGRYYIRGESVPRDDFFPFLHHGAKNEIP